MILFIFFYSHVYTHTHTNTLFLRTSWETADSARGERVEIDFAHLLHLTRTSYYHIGNARFPRTYIIAHRVTYHIIISLYNRLHLPSSSLLRTVFYTRVTIIYLVVYRMMSQLYPGDFLTSRGCHSTITVLLVSVLQILVLTRVHLILVQKFILR